MEEEGEGYVAFKGRQAKGVLYRLNTAQPELIKRMETYVHGDASGSAMQRDIRFVRAVYGLVNTSGRKDFEIFWESPWNEEHVQDAPKKRKLEAQQRSMAVRSYIRASSMAQDADNVGKFLETVDQLTQWEDRHDAKEIIKTVSRMVQSFERTAIRSVALFVDAAPYNGYKDEVQEALNLNSGDDENNPLSVGSSEIERTACSLRRDKNYFDLFAAVVAAEIIWADATNGTRAMPKHLCERLLGKKQEAMINFVRTIRARRGGIVTDTVGMPLMETNGSMCVARGVLVVCPGSESATYVLDIEPQKGPLDLSKVRTITITQVLEDQNVMNAPAAP
jgi:hypothetical protein